MNANSLLILWFEYMGYAENHASELVSILLFCNCLSSLFFGWFGDYMHVKNSKYGRLLVALSVLSIQIVFTCLLYLDVPVHPDEMGDLNRDTKMMNLFPIFTGVLIVLGLFGDADQQCCDLPILADIVPHHIRGFAYSLLDMVQCFFAFLATVFVGVLAEDTFGFVHDKNKPIKDWDPTTRAINTRALGSALLTVNMVAMIGSFIIYGLMLYTYPKDVKEMAIMHDTMQRRRVEEDDGGSEDGVALLSDDRNRRQDE